MPDILDVAAPNTDLARTMNGLSDMVWTYLSWVEEETPTEFYSPLPDIMRFTFTEQGGGMVCVCETKELLGDDVLSEPMHLEPRYDASGAFLSLRGSSSLPRSNGPTTFDFALNGDVLQVHARWKSTDGYKGATTIQVHRRSAIDFGTPTVGA